MNTMTLTKKILTTLSNSKYNIELQKKKKFLMKATTKIEVKLSKLFLEEKILAHSLSSSMDINKNSIIFSAMFHFLLMFVWTETTKLLNTFNTISL